MTVRQMLGMAPAATAIVLGACTHGDAASRPAPSITMAGVIEGFYGSPWSHHDRLDMLAFMGRVGLNHYVYAPKNDPYHRTRWRDPYPAAARAELEALVRTARANDVTMWFALSPGLSITYSDSADYALLMQKIDDVAGLGVTHFGLFVDDVPYEMGHEADRAAYPSLAAAHVDLTNRLYADLHPRGLSLSLTPTTYTDAWGDRDYLATVGRGVHSDVPVVWTGPDVASPTIAISEVTRWHEVTGRQPLVWDNYPVNDYARWRLFLGPFVGRDRGLGSVVVGLVANPMNEAHASMLPLATLAEYARDPAGYDPAGAAARAAETLYGPAVARDLLPFLEIYGDYGWDEHVFEPLYALRDTVELTPIEEALARLRTSLTQLHAASTGEDSVRVLIEEIEPFVEGAAERLAELEAADYYERRESQLVYDGALDRVDVSTDGETILVDGRLDDWESASWRTLFRRDGSPSPTRVAFRARGDRLFIAATVPTATVDARAGLRVGEGDHLALIVDRDPEDGPIDRSDGYVLVAPPVDNGEAAGFVGALTFEGFMAKWLADNRALTFAEFHLSTFGSEGAPAFSNDVTYAALPTPTGYTVELAVPREGRDRMRVSLTVTDTDGGKQVVSLARRNYPANPATFAELQIR